MEYIIASLGAILAATLIVYKLANNILGIDLRLRPLLLCSIGAMLISLVLPKIVVGFAGLPGTLAVLAIFAVIFAYFIARYEGEPPVQETDTESDVACCFATEQSSPNVSADNFETVSGELNGSVIMGEYSNQFIEPTIASVEAASDSIQSNAKADISEKDTAGLQEPQKLLDDLSEAENLVEQMIDFPESLKDTETSTDTLDEAASELVLEPFNEQEEVGLDEHREIMNLHAIDSLVLPEESEVSIETSNESTAKLVLDSLIDGEFALAELAVTNEMPEESEESEASAEVVNELEQMSDEALVNGENQEGIMLMPEQPFVQEADNLMVYNEQMAEDTAYESEELDDLLESAFINKERQDYNAAFNAFNRALTLYPNSDAAPFLIVELGNILKNRGAYDDAIKVFLDGRALSQAKNDKIMEQEFVSTIAYLRIIKNVLLQNRLGCTPFFEIPSQILAQIDEEFKEWRSVGCR